MVCLPKSQRRQFLSVKRKPFFHLILFITILVLTSLACQAVTDIFEDDYGYYDEEPTLMNRKEYESDLLRSTAGKHTRQ